MEFSLEGITCWLKTSWSVFNSKTKYKSIHLKIKGSLLGNWFFCEDCMSCIVRWKQQYHNWRVVCFNSRFKQVRTSQQTFFCIFAERMESTQLETSSSHGMNHLWLLRLLGKCKKRQRRNKDWNVYSFTDLDSFHTLKTCKQ